MVQIEIKMIGTKIAEARKRAGLSQAQLSEQLFISPQAVGKWERGESIPDIITFNKLAQILNVDLYYFLNSDPNTFQDSAVNETAHEIPVEIPEDKPVKKRSWNMSHTNWIDADFSGLNNLHEKFNMSNMQKCKFVGSDLSGLQLKHNNIQDCDFTNSNISNSVFQGSNLQKVMFNDCSLKQTKFGAANIENCDFTGADLREATFKYSNLSKCILTNAILTQTNFNGSSIENTVFEGVIEDCAFENSSFSKVTIQNTKIINTFFKGTRLKRINFINCQVDRLTYEFLKSGKADLTNITLI